MSTADGTIDEIFNISSDEDDDTDELFEYYEIGSDSDEDNANSPLFAGFQPFDDKSAIPKIERIEPMEQSAEQLYPTMDIIQPNGPVLDAMPQPEFQNMPAEATFEETLPFTIERPREIEADTTSE